MKIWQRIFLAALVVTIVFMNLIGMVLIRSQYRQNLENIRRAAEQKMEVLQEKLEKEVNLNLSSARGNSVFAADDSSLSEAVQTIVRQEEGSGICILLDGKAYANTDYEERKIEGPEWRENDGRLLFSTAFSGRFYGRSIEIAVQNDATAVKEAYWNQMNRLLLYGCLFSVLGAALLMGLVFGLLYPLKTLRQGVHAIAGGKYETRLKVQGHTELTELSLDVNEMAEKIQRTIEKLEETAENRRAFIGNMAHEMKTPLTSILGFADILSINPGLSEEERREYSEIIVKEATRLRNLSGKLMELVQIQNGMIEFRLLNLREVAEESVAIQEMLMKEKGISITAKLEDAWIWGDYELLQSLLLNLLDNSRKASEPGGKIELFLKAGKNEVSLSIRDFGRGMDPKETEKVKEPFYMVDKTRSRKDGGAGLGLALCAEIMELHHGIFDIKSEPGKGCLVTLKFERGKEDESERENRDR